MNKTNKIKTKVNGKSDQNKNQGQNSLQPIAQHS